MGKIRGDHERLRTPAPRRRQRLSRKQVLSVLPARFAQLDELDHPVGIRKDFADLKRRIGRQRRAGGERSHQ
jgi:hypothetical protein